MKDYFIYPYMFPWEFIIPRDYPFIRVQGPDNSIGCLLVFDTMEAYMAYCKDDYIAPMVVQQGVRDGQQQN